MSAAPGLGATPAADGTTVLDLQDVRKSFGRSQILTGVNLTVAAGERHAIIGPNGAGKSTLFDVISARCAPSGGSIRLKGEDIAGLSARLVRRRGLSRSFQINNLFSALTVFDNLRCAVLWPLGYGYSFWQRLARHDVDERASAVLEQIGLTKKRDAIAAVLTYAEQRALEIGITIAGGAGVVLLDEPTSGMSRSESDEAVALIRKVSEGKTLLLVEHDMNVVFGLADRISVLVYGRILATGTPADIRANAAVQEAYLGA